MNLLRSLAALGTCLLLATPATQAAPVEIKIATVVPEGTGWMTAMREASAEIDQRTGGRVRFKFYGGGVQGNDAQVQRKMRVGQLHGGVFTSGALRLFEPRAELYGLPLLFNDFDEVAFVRRQMDADLRQMLEDAGYVNFGFAGGGFAYLMSRSPIASRADMRGVKVWIPEGDDIARRASIALGISPVTLPLTDVLTGLQTDLIDTVMGPPVGVIVMQWHTAMKYITDLPIAYVYATLLVDKRVFARLSGEDQAVVREVMGKVYEGFDAEGVAEDLDALQALLDEGLQKVAVSPEQQSEWRQLFAETSQAAARDGVVSAPQLERLGCLLAAYRAGDLAATCAP